VLSIHVDGGVAVHVGGHVVVYLIQVHCTWGMGSKISELPEVKYWGVKQRVSLRGSGSYTHHVQRVKPTAGVRSAQL
jgi:hypothetical protein